MFVNKKLTLTRFVLVLSLAVTAMLLFATQVSAFSEIYYPEETKLLSLDEKTVEDGPVNVTLVKDGNEYDYTYFPVECSEFLSYAGISLTEVNELNVLPETVLYDNMMIDVSTVRYLKHQVLEVAEYDYDLIYVDTVPKGELKPITEGINGQKNVTYIEKFVDGVSVSKEVIAEEILIPAVNGTAEYGIGGTVTASDGTVYNYSYKKYMEATAYTYIPGLTTMTTATGRTLAKGIVAVDPKVIPLHTKMYIASDTFEYGFGEAEDTGGVIKGDIVDLAFMSYEECVNFGRRHLWVYVLE